MIDLLPLERNAVLTEINIELATFGKRLIIRRGLEIDRAASVYELATHIYAKFPEVDIPFFMVFDKVSDFVQKHIDYDAEMRLKNKKAWE